MAGSFICAMLIVGSTLQVFGLFIIPASETFGLSRANTNNGLIFAMVAMAIWSPIAGKLIDRYPARLIMAFGAFAYGVSFLIIANTTSLWVIGLSILGPLGLSIVCSGALVANTVTARWFFRQRGKAMGIMAVSTSAGGFTLTPIFAYLISQFGWQGTLNIVAIVIPTIILATIVLVVRDRPDEHLIATCDEFTSHPASDQCYENERTWKLKELLHNSDFWLLGFGTGLLLGCDAALMATKVPYLLDAGIGLDKAALFAACTTGSAIAGKIIAGLLADRIDPRRLFGFVVLCHLVLLSTLVILPDYWILITVASLFGMAVGGVYPVWLSLSVRVFGAKTYGTVIGSMAIIMQPISIIAIRFIGEVRDFTGDYALGFVIFAIAAICSYLLISRVRFPGEMITLD